jgi:hypothetical protein
LVIKPPFKSRRVRLNPCYSQINRCLVAKIKG